MVVDFHIDDPPSVQAPTPALRNIVETNDASRRLHHRTPSWVKADSIFHIRCRVARKNDRPLTEPKIAGAILQSTAFNHEQATWFCHLMLVMPDHWHALLSFPGENKMVTVIGRWKAWQTRTLKISWQENFFDHRIRDEHELELKTSYIRNNPVIKGLCQNSEDWPWQINFPR